MYVVLMVCVDVVVCVLDEVCVMLVCGGVVVVFESIIVVYGMLYLENFEMVCVVECVVCV